MAAKRADKNEIRATQHASGQARSLAETMPRLILESRRIAATVIHGLHGRKRAGPGENFWQYRRFVSGEPARRVDWRRSARDDNLYVREQEWEAAHRVDLAGPLAINVVPFTTRTRVQTRSNSRHLLCARRGAGAGG